MKDDLVKGFYGDEKTGYRGITKKAVTGIIKTCEKNMLKWINTFSDQKIAIWATAKIAVKTLLKFQQ